MSWIDDYNNYLENQYRMTKLSPYEEEMFGGWVENTNMFQRQKGRMAQKTGMDIRDISNEDIMNQVINDPRAKYDYRGAFVGGIDDNGDEWLDKANDGRNLRRGHDEEKWKEMFTKEIGQDPVNDLKVKKYEDAEKWYNARDAEQAQVNDAAVEPSPHRGKEMQQDVQNVISADTKSEKKKMAVSGLKNALNTLGASASNKKSPQKASAPHRGSEMQQDVQNVLKSNTNKDKKKTAVSGLRNAFKALGAFGR